MHPLRSEPETRKVLAAELRARKLISDEADWRPLSGGRTNDLWHVHEDQFSWVVKLYPEDRQTPLFRNDGIAEAAMLTALDGTDLSADLHISTTSSLGPCVIYHFVDGTAWHSDPVPVARLLSRLHALPVEISLPVAPSGSDALREQGMDILSECDGHLRQTVFDAMPRLDVPPTDQQCLLHGDVVANNILMTDLGPRLIDWQCPMLGEPAADIAIFLSPAMQILYDGTPPNSLFKQQFFTAYGVESVKSRYLDLAPWYHWRMAAYCLWKAERGAQDYLPAIDLELAAVSETA